MTRRYSAIVPNYNDSKKIGESLSSLVSQTMPFHEIIIVDDASTDDSYEMVAHLIKSIPQAKLLRHAQNKGVVGAINSGIAEATGDFIFLCSANDIYYPMMVEWCDDMLERYPQAGIVSGNVASFDQETQKFTYAMKLPLPQRREYYTPEQLVARNRKVGVHFNGGANALRLDLVREFGGLREPLRWHSDWFLNLMIAFRTGVAYVPENFSICRLEGKKSYSSNRFFWPLEREVIRDSLITLKMFPREAELFRKSALLPKYDLRAPAIFLSRQFHWFVTPLLVWRMVMHSLTYRMKYIVPRPFLMYFRPFFRV